MNMPNALIGSKELARLLGVSLRTLDTLHKKGSLPPDIRIGHQRRWRVADIEAWIEKRIPK
jgi:excisionase family DNA binding protein